MGFFTRRFDLLQTGSGVTVQKGQSKYLCQILTSVRGNQNQPPGTEQSMIGGGSRSLKNRIKLRSVRAWFNQAFGRNILAGFDYGLDETLLRWQPETLPLTMKTLSFHAKVVLHSYDPKSQFLRLERGSDG